MRVIRKLFKSIIVATTFFLFLNFSSRYAYADIVSRLYIDNPISNQAVILDGNNITIDGWSLNTSGTKDVKIYINGNLQGDAAIGLHRPDVSQIYPGYPEGDDSGFKYTLSSNLLVEGMNKIVIQATGNNGEIRAAARTIRGIRRLNAGNLDEPINLSTVIDNNILVRGWYLNSSGTEKVEIYLNNALYAITSTNYERNDIKRNYIEYPNSLNTGFESNIDINKVHPGENNLKIVMYGKDGSSKSYYRKIFVEKKPGRGYIDEPKFEAALENSLVKVRGWAINASGIKEIKILLNGEFVGNATQGLKREDVFTAYPEYLDSTISGYDYFLSTKNIKAGISNLEVEVHGNDGTVNRYYRTFNITKQINRGYIDNPVGDIYGNKLTTRGWSLHEDGVKEVRVYIDNIYKTNAEININRSDVAQAYPKYSGAELSGFSAEVDVTELSPGMHQLQIVSEGIDGSIHRMSRQINIIKPINRLIIDEPSSKTIFYNEDILIKGWSMNASGTKNVKVYVNGVENGSATLGIYRPDVYKIYSQYPEENYSGFEHKLNIDTMPPGEYEVVIRSVGNDGTSMDAKRQIVITKPVNRTIVDYPTSADKKISISDVVVRGWAVNASGISNIRIMINGLDIGSPIYGLPRPDVNTAYGYYKDSLNSGYEIKIQPQFLKSGINELQVHTLGNDGTTNVKKELFYLQELYYFNSYYSKTLNSALQVQMTKKPQTDLYGGGWKNAAEADVLYQLNPKSHYLFDNGRLENDSINKIIITTDMLNIRSGPSSAHRIIGTALANQIYDVIEFNSGWINIKVGNTDGWIAETYTAKIGAEKGVPADTRIDEMLQFVVLSDYLGVNKNEYSMLLKGKGILENLGEIMLETSRANNINELYVLVHTLLETGNGTSSLSNGILVSSVNNTSVVPKITYNMFGIGAHDIDPERLGAEYAYNQGWFTPEAAIKGGIEWLSNQYINNNQYKQNTLYKMRWNPALPGIHQYATDIGWATKQSKMMQLVSDYAQSLKIPIRMDIPVYLTE